MKNKKIGFIGQGWIGKNYADDFEKRGFKVVRYSLEDEHNGNKEAIAECDIVFIAVPTPTTPKGFDDSIIKSVMPLIGIGKIAVLKSTLLPGTTQKIQKENPKIFVFHSPEFLTEATAEFDAANPTRNIVGIPTDNKEYKKKAQEVIEVLPKAPFNLICLSTEAEFVKYGGNCWFYFKVIFVNMLYDLAGKSEVNWETVRDAMSADPRIGRSHLDPVHKSGRGAGGNCFIKDFEAFSRLYENMVGDKKGVNALNGIRDKNIDLLLATGKDLELLKGVYGEDILLS